PGRCRAPSRCPRRRGLSRTRRSRYRSTAEPAPVDGEDLAVDVIGGSRREEHDRSAKIVGLAPAPGRDPRVDLGGPHRVVAPDARIDLRLDVAGRDRVHVNAAPGPFVAGRLRLTADGALGG